jgi:hypothetical protein
LEAKNFSPLKGEIIVYDAEGENGAARIKVGDGVTNVNDLPFIGSMDDLNLITVEDIDTICNGTFQYVDANEAVF